MSRILVAEMMDPRAVAQLAARHEVRYDADLIDKPAELLREAAHCDALIVRNRTQVRGALLAALGASGRCKAVGRLGVGMDNIDMEHCQRLGIAVFPASGANALSVAEYVIASTMMLLRGVYASSAAVAAGQWPRAALGLGRETAGKTMGIIGFGSIGQTVARLARSLGMRVIAFDAMLGPDAQAFADLGVPCVGLPELLAQADVVSLHVPLLPSTQNLFNAKLVASMKRGAVLINTSRGPVVDLPAVAQALRSGHLGGAAIDVFEPEPLPATAYLQDCPNLLLTPHISGQSAESNERVSFMIADAVLQALD